MAKHAATNGGNGWNSWRLARWLAGLALLLIPAVMMQVAPGWQWGPADFVFAAAMIFGTLGVYDLATRMPGGWAYRAGAALALAAVFLLVWINLAVGIIGDEGNPLNAMYFGVIALGLAGAFAARFRPAGMARALFVAAFAQLAVAAVAVVAGPNEPPGLLGVLGLNLGFALMLAVSGALFRRAGDGGTLQPNQ
jgi:hypothetical protein